MNERNVRQAFACRLPAAPEAVPLARGVVDGLEWLHVAPEREFELRLLVSEVVTNAVKHGCRNDPDEWIGLAVAIEDDTLRVRVSDAGRGFRPRVVQPEPDAPAGRGLHVLETLADRWGVRRRDERTEVWFELSPISADREARAS
jgi:anti-sigma regulatory factor (Ser/Thr protein kinase)